MGLILCLTAKHAAGDQKRIASAFEVLHEGTGPYAPKIRSLLSVGSTFVDGDDFVTKLQKLEGSDKATHTVNPNSLWALDVAALQSRVLVAK